MMLTAMAPLLRTVRPFLWIIGMVLGLTGCQSSAPRILVSSWSAGEEGLEVGAATARVEKGYVMASGAVHPSLSKDRSFERADFAGVVEAMIPALKKANHFLAPPLFEEIDLLLVVHYGVTGQNALENIAILNISDKIIRLPYFLDEYQQLLRAIEDNQYFFVVAAYDMDDLRQGRKSLRWITRFSTPQRGTNFQDALASITTVAADYFGTDFESGFTRAAYHPHGRGGLGEMEVLGTAEE